MTMTCTSDRSGIASTGVRSVAHTPAADIAMTASTTEILCATDQWMIYLSIGGYLDVVVGAAGIPGIPFMSPGVPEFPAPPPLMLLLSPVLIMLLMTSPRFDSESMRNCADVRRVVRLRCRRGPPCSRRTCVPRLHRVVPACLHQCQRTQGSDHPSGPLRYWVQSMRCVSAR